MAEQRTPIYREPHPAAYEGEARLRQDLASHYWLGNVKVVTLRPQDDFTALACVDGTTHFVRTDDLAQAAPGPLRAVYCACGALLVGVDDEELFGMARAHASHAHPDEALTDDQISAVVRANAFDAGRLPPR